MPAQRRTTPRVALPAELEHERRRYEAYVDDATALLERFAREHAWEAHVATAVPSVVEVYRDQQSLWRRLRAAFALPPRTPLPTPTLAGAVVGDALAVLTPDAYARVAPHYGAAAGAYVRLIAHELAHRLHVAILAGDEDAMGPRWFYEGFAVLASGDLQGLPEPDLATLWASLHDDGPGAYARYGAALRRLARTVPLPELVAAAGRDDFEGWLRSRVERAERGREGVG